MIITQSDFHTNRFSGFRHTPFPKSRFIMSYLICPELCPFIIIIPMSHPYVMHLIIHMFNTSVMPYISLDQYLTPNLYSIPNVQNMRFFCCLVYKQFAILILIGRLRGFKEAKLMDMLLDKCVFQNRFS